MEVKRLKVGLIGGERPQSISLRLPEEGQPDYCLR
jgi:hypothetical protein